METKRGFTLIELLVVISIISLLSSIVLSALSSARGKAADTTVKADLANIRAMAELYYSDNGNYGPMVSNCSGVFFTSANIYSAIGSADAASGGGASCFSNGTAWAISHTLKTTGTYQWCVDWTGASRQITGATPGVTCPSS